MKNERRKYIRYVFKSKELHVYIHGCDVVEKIQNISMGGLAFEYPAAKTEGLPISLIDIYWNFEESTYLSMIPCEVVYDNATLPEGATFRGKFMRRCGLKYKSISKAHQECLKTLFAVNDTMPV